MATVSGAFMFDLKLKSRAGRCHIPAHAHDPESLSWSYAWPKDQEQDRDQEQDLTIDTQPPLVTILAPMRFPLALTSKIASYIITNKLRRTPKFATVLQLEPLHTCNLTCTGCGRIREYSTSLKDILPLEDCLSAARECKAPMVSICGGEPLIYPQIEALVNGLLGQKRIVYICTNAMFMRKKMREWMTSEYRKPQTGKRKDLEAKLDQLIKAGLVSEKDADVVRQGPK